MQAHLVTPLQATCITWSHLITPGRTSAGNLSNLLTPGHTPAGSSHLATPLQATCITCSHLATPLHHLLTPGHTPAGNLHHLGLLPLPPAACVCELGAGKGYLGHCLVQVCGCERLVLVDQGVFKNKVGGRL